MPESSWSFKSQVETLHFRRTPEGLVFTGPPPWMFGRSRAYRVSDAQAGQLVARIGRANFISIAFIIVAVLIVAMTAVAVMDPVTPGRLFVEHPIAASSAFVMFVILLVGLFLGMFQWAVRPVLAGVAWTSAPREPYLKKLAFYTTTGMAALPTPVLVIVVVMGLIGLPMFAIKAYEALASGQLNLDVFIAAMLLLTLVEFGAALVIKLNRRR